MKGLNRYLLESPFMREVLETLETERCIEISGGFEEMHIVLTRLFAMDMNRGVIVVQNNLFHAQKMYETMKENGGGALFYPQDDFVTTDMLAASETLKAERLNTIKHLLDNPTSIVVTHPAGFIRKMMPKDAYLDARKTYAEGDAVGIEAFVKTLIRFGYVDSATVEKSGEFTRRGSIVDVFPSDAESPVRIDFFDEDIESIRTFDVNTQRSTERVEAFTLFTRHEFFYGQEALESLGRNVLRIIEERSLSSETRARVERELETLRNYEDQDKLNRYTTFLPCGQATLSEHLQDPLVLFINKPSIEKAIERIAEDIGDWKSEVGDYAALGFDFIAEPDRIHHTNEIRFNPFPKRDADVRSFPLRAKEGALYQSNLHALKKDLVKYEGHSTVYVTLNDEERLKHFNDTFSDDIDIKILGVSDKPFVNRINALVCDNALAYEWFDANVVVLNERAVFETPKKRKVKYASVFKDTKRLTDAKALRTGDHLVHYEHGIGRFGGIETMRISGHTNDYVVIQYRGDDVLYIPVENIHLVQRYEAHEGIVPKLSRLGSGEWERTKKRVRKRTKDIANALIKLYAAREKAKGFAFSEDSGFAATLAADFEYEETPDQQAAIEAVEADMQSPRPMDRLICGDVGYGKTEVALRAAAKAVLDNKQVAYLAPTTVLSRQHYHTFKNRLEKHGIRCELLNRFVPPEKQREVLKGLKDGSVDIALGTHRLLSSDVQYRDLGLLIIDEEQRFGVEHKEKIKTLKVSLDVLSLSATPIPRTMQMALTNVKEMSLLETPPKNRLPVQTYVLPRNDQVVKDAIERELARDGQIFYLYNRIETIENVRDALSRLVPDARIAFAHGQMSRARLEHVVERFLDREFDVLVSTTIIETGIDIPNANTLIIHEADNLGLAQLYQIRGRVGRSDRIAYSYLMYDKDKELTEEAEKRLRAIKEFTELGSGYKIAVRDLAIRGAGDLLGTEQSGFIDSVGIHLFLEILKEEIDKEKGEKTIDPIALEKAKQAIRFEVDKTIPADYIDEEDLRISFHRRINDVKTSHDLILLKDEMKDRFGEIPRNLDIYMHEKLYEHLAVEAGIEKALTLDTRIQLVFNPHASATINGERLFSKANDISPYIRLAYRREKMHVTIDRYKIDRHPLHVIIELLESL